MAVRALEVVGREAELAAIERFVGAAREAPSALVLQGEAGIGKTTLWRAGVERARAQGDLVLVAHPAEAETELAFSALSDVLAPTLESLAEHLPAPQLRALRVAFFLEESEAPSDERGIRPAVAAALAALAAHGATLL